MSTKRPKPATPTRRGFIALVGGLMAAPRALAPSSEASILRSIAAMPVRVIAPLESLRAEGRHPHRTEIEQEIEQRCDEIGGLLAAQGTLKTRAEILALVAAGTPPRIFIRADFDLSKASDQHVKRILADARWTVAQMVRERDGSQASRTPGAGL